MAKKRKTTKTTDRPNPKTARVIDDALKGKGLSGPMTWEEAKAEILS
ncbi:MAG: hypothetical protein BWY98_01279 [Tenericutes bacterium ADurb.BinA155]|jgi:NAD(P)H-hydrate repair Nnr-like enzyme with NAD(P)H-hydrate epimerase domain|nr:MAG: hypothetical protein BWY98_01279 [Tenericutes bacterium ADurb.BinA155]